MGSENVKDPNGWIVLARRTRARAHTCAYSMVVVKMVGRLIGWCV